MKFPHSDARYGACTGNMKTLTVILTLALFAGQSDAGSFGKSRSWIERTPATASASENPYAGESDAVLAGAKLFHRYCASCHGQDANGIEKAPGLRSAAVQRASPGALFWLLRNGILQKGMPSWSHLPGQQRWQIVTWLKSIQ